MSNMIPITPKPPGMTPVPPTPKPPGMTPVPPAPNVDVINNIIINLDNVYSALINSLNAQVNKLIQDFNKLDDKILSQLNATIKAVETSNKAYYNRVEQGLKEQVDLLNSNTTSIIDRLVKPILDTTNRIEKDDLEFSKKAQISLEALLNRLIETQLSQTNSLVKTIEDNIASLITTISETDYVSEENIADWIKQAFEPLEISWPNWMKPVDDSASVNPFNPFQPLLDAIDYLVERIRAVKNSFDKLENGEYASIDAFKTDIFGSELAGDIGESVMFAFLIVPLFKEIVQAIYAKMFTELNFLALRKATPARLNETDAFNLFRRGLLTSGEMYEQLLDKGWSEDLIFKQFQLSFANPNMGDVFELYRREEIDRETFNNSLKIAGFNETWINKLEKLTRFIAPPQDVIRFMVRDVFNEEIVREGGTDIGWDNPDFLEQARYSGIDPELARRYWIAHWQLPSVNQGYEMFQREEISRERLESLFVAADVAPNWREPLLAMSYNLPTKVDVRRAYEDDIIQDDKLKEYIRHNGTPPEWRDIIFNWYKSRKLKLQTKKDNVRSFSTRDIIKGYNSGVLQQSEAVQRLVASGWTTNDAILLLQINVENELLRANEGFTSKLREQMRNAGIEGYRSRTLSKQESKDLLQQSGINEELALAMLNLVDTQYKLDRKVEIVSAVRKLYIGYEISEHVLFDTMLRNGFTQQEIDEHIRDLKPLRELRYKELTRADIKKGVKEPSLGIAWGVEKLKGLGYSNQTIKEIMIIEDWEDT